LTWALAERSCGRSVYYANHHLASITSKEENSFVANLANSTVWIGAEAQGVYRGERHFSSEYISLTNHNNCILVIILLFNVSFIAKVMYGATTIL
jgi:hypothetical protein